VIIHAADARRYWAEGLDGGASGGKPPDCASDDAVTGYGDPGGVCRRCPLGEFGSDTKGGRGQACKQARLLFVLLPGELLPAVVSLPPTSLKSARSYFLQRASKGIPFYGIVTRFRLETEKNKDGIAYSRVAMEQAGDRLTTEEVAKLRALRDAYAPLFAATKAEAKDFVAAKALSPSREPGAEG
jgi:hypothetical protein